MQLRRIGVGEFALAVVTLFTLLAGQFWRNLTDWTWFGVIAVAIFVTYAVLLIVHRNSFRHRGFPLTLVVFFGWAVLSLIWSQYQGTTALALVILFATTIAGFGLAYLMPWSTFVRAFSIALRLIIGLSLFFELYVALVIGHPIAANFRTPDYAHEPVESWWCAGKIFEGAPIQGILGNRNLLGFVALLAIVVISVQLADRVVSRLWGTFWLVLAVLTTVLTQSATVFVAMGLVLICCLLALWARKRGDGRHRLVYWTALTFFVVVALVGVLFGPLIAQTIGRSPDFTGRFDIWNATIALWQQHPVLGWGWISYWAPWVYPFQDLIVVHGVMYLQAHNAWLDVGMQLGWIGLIMFTVFVITAVWRAWFRAVDRPRWDARTDRPFVALHMLPLFILACLIAQSLAESRLLIEGGWALLVICAVATKLPDTLNEHPRLLTVDAKA